MTWSGSSRGSCATDDYSFTGITIPLIYELWDADDLLSGLKNDQPYSCRIAIIRSIRDALRAGR
jgi:hypothetical protein